MAGSRNGRSRVWFFAMEGREQAPKLGDRIEIYCTNLDQSTNAFDRYYVAQGDKIVDMWPIMGRSGPAQLLTAPPRTNAKLHSRAFLY